MHIIRYAKRGGNNVQTMPNIAVNGGQIPPLPLGEQFTYLGRSYGFDLKNDAAKLALEKKPEAMLQLILKHGSELLTITNDLEIRVQTKLKILSLYKVYIHSQIMFDIKLYDFPATWVEQKLDALCIRHMRVWLEMPVSKCVSERDRIPS